MAARAGEAVPAEASELLAAARVPAGQLPDLRFFVWRELSFVLPSTRGDPRKGGRDQGLRRIYSGM